MKEDISFINKEHFKKNPPVGYEGGWILRDSDNKQAVIWDDVFNDEFDKERSWSSEIEEIHEKPTKNGWIDIYEREQVMKTMGEVLKKRKSQLIVEFGASVGYMIEEIRNEHPKQKYVAMDIMPDGLRKSYKRNPYIYHVQCDFSDAPIRDNSVDVLYALNVLEHITDDIGTIAECFRVLKHGGYCLFVVPKGKKLYDYFDEMLFHKRRYANGELKRKALEAGFVVVQNYHLAWMCYPIFWMKKKLNQIVGKRLSQEEKFERVKRDVKSAMASPLAISMICMEEVLGKVIKPPYGVRELILLKKE